MLLGLASSSTAMENREPFDKPLAIERFREAEKGGFAPLFGASDRLLRRRAWSKPAARTGSGCHEESILAR
jgi:hypothetical protein